MGKSNEYRLYNYKTGERYSDHPNLEGAMLSAVRLVANGQQVRWDGGPLVWFGYVNRQKLPTFGVDLKVER